MSNTVIALFTFGFVGVVIVLISIVLMGWSSETKIENWDQAAELMKADYPDLTIESGLISIDNRAALLQFAQPYSSNLGLVTVLGDKWVTRLITHKFSKLILMPNGVQIKADSDASFVPVSILLSPTQSEALVHQFATKSEIKFGTTT